MVERVVTKQLAGLEDLLLGEGTEDQARYSGTRTISKINLLHFVDTIDAVRSVDYTKYLHVQVASDVAASQFFWDADSTAADDGVNILTPVTNPAIGRWRLQPFQGAGGVTQTTSESQVAIAGQTVFTLLTISYVQGIGNLLVHVNGVYQYPASYTEYPDGITIIFSEALEEGDEVLFTTGEVITTTISAESIKYTPAGTGATVTNVQDKLREFVSVKDFGADPSNTAAANDAAIQAALNAANGKVLLFPAGTYLVSASFTATYTENTAIIATGARLDYTAAVTFAFDISNPTHFTEFAGFEIDGNDLLRRGVRITGSSYIHNNNIFLLYADYASGVSAIGIYGYATSPSRIFIERNRVNSITAEDAGATEEGSGSSVGIYTEITSAATGSDIRIDNNTVSNCYGREGTCVYIAQGGMGASDASSVFYITNNKLNGANRRVIKCQVKQVIIDNNYIISRSISDASTLSAISGPVCIISVQAAGGVYPQRCKVTNNNIQNLGGTGVGIIMLGVGHLVDGNRIWVNNAATTTGGILLQDAIGCKVSNNYIDMPQAQLSAYDTTVAFGSRDNIFENNTINCIGTCRAAFLDLSSTVVATQHSTTFDNYYINNTVIDNTDSSNLLGLAYVSFDTAFAGDMLFKGNVIESPVTYSTSLLRALLLYINGAVSLTSAGKIRFLDNHINTLSGIAYFPSSPDTTDLTFLGNTTERESYTVAELALVPGYSAGSRTFVSNSNATLAAGHGNIVAGGGANYVPVYYDGTNWLIG